ncbi:MAG: ankyrin repeat domain-containing protein [Candidatus Dependentiae bacterium]|nr:ankyrin repeat domain-containing protein [Candidatus Dependentiae bacterium]
MNNKKSFISILCVTVAFHGAILSMQRGASSIGAGAVGVLGANNTNGINLKRLPENPQSRANQDVLNQAISQAASGQSTQPWTNQKMYSGAGAFKSTPLKLDKNYQHYHMPKSYPGSDLVLAVEQGNLNALKKMIAAGANVNQDDCFLLTKAARYGDIPMIKELIRAGADMNAADENGNTPLLMSIKMLDIAPVKELIHAGVDLNKPDFNGNTPLIVAAMNGKTQVVRFLVSAGAKLDVQNKAGQTALELATKYGHKQIIDILIHDAHPVQTEEEKTMDGFLAWLSKRF